MSAFDELERQLLRSVRRRSDRRRPRRLGAGGNWRGTRTRRGLLLLAIPLAFAAAAAAATIATRTDGDSATLLFNRVLIATRPGPANSGPCRSGGGRRAASLSDEATDPRITAVLPELASAPQDPPSSETVTAAERSSGGAVLARTIREVRMPGGVTLILYVAHGEGPFTAVDPRECLAARLAALARLRPNASDPLRRRVARVLELQPDTNQRIQSLSLLHEQDGRIEGGGSDPLPPGRALPTGVTSWGYGCTRHGCSPTLYTGIVGPGTAYLTLAPARHARAGGRGVHRRVAVVQGLFAFTLARDAGRESITQRAANGRPLVTRVLPSAPGAHGHRR
jgi:hypothetical protein